MGRAPTTDSRARKAAMTQANTLPSQAAFLHAILRHLVGCPDGDRRQDVHEAMPGLLNLNEQQRTERLPNLPHLRYRHRSGFGLSILKAAGYVENPSRGIWRITVRGRDLLASHPHGFDDETARQLIRESRLATRTLATIMESTSAEPPHSKLQTNGLTPRSLKSTVRLRENFWIESGRRRRYFSKGWSSTCCTPWDTGPRKRISSASGIQVTAELTGSYRSIGSDSRRSTFRPSVGRRRSVDPRFRRSTGRLRDGARGKASSLRLQASRGKPAIS